MTVRDIPTAHRSAGLAYATVHDAPTVSEVAMRARLAVWALHPCVQRRGRGYDIALQSGPPLIAFDALAVGVRDIPSAHRSAGLAHAAVADVPTVSEVAMRPPLAVWRFTHASRGEAAAVRFCAAKCPSHGRV